MGGEERVADEFYPKKSAKNTQKSTINNPKTPKISKLSKKNSQKSESHGHTLMLRNVGNWERAGEELYPKKSAKNHQNSTLKDQNPPQKTTIKDQKTAKKAK